MHIVVGIACFVLAWLLRPLYDRESRMRGFLSVADEIHSFAEGYQVMEAFKDSSGWVLNPRCEFGKALYASLVELATTQEELDWISSHAQPLGGTKDPAFEMFMRKRKSLPHGSWTCPTCSIEYDGSERFCPRDGTAHVWMGPLPSTPRTRMASSAL
jgi:hypothetical protein